MLERLKAWILAWLGIRVENIEDPVERFAAAYEDIHGEDIAELTPRAQLISDAITRLWENDVAWITAQAFGKGGVVLAPSVTEGGRLRVDVADQSRAVVLRRDGDKPTNVALVAEQVTLNDRRFNLMVNYELTGDGQIIRYRAVDEGGAPVGLATIPQWAEITPEVRIGGTDRLLLAFLLCPRDNRRTSKDAGVPITYGAEKLIAEMVEHANIYRREFRLTRPMLGLDATLWRNGFDGAPDIRQVRRTVQDADDPFVPVERSSVDGTGNWQYFAPAIRYEAMDARWQNLARRLEKACGLSQGILTERQALNYANRDEVRAAQYDTFSVIRAMRTRWERAMDDLAYALDALAERARLTPQGGRGQFQLAFDWDTSLIESSAETFEQYLELNSRGALSDVELRQWVKGGTLEEAEQAVAEMKQEAPEEPDEDLKRLLEEE